MLWILFIAFFIWLFVSHVSKANAIEKDIVRREKAIEKLKKWEIPNPYLPQDREVVVSATHLYHVPENEMNDFTLLVASLGGDVQFIRQTEETSANNVQVKILKN